MLVFVSLHAHAYFPQRNPFVHGCLTQSELEKKKCTPCYIKARTVVTRFAHVQLEDEWQINKTVLGQLVEMRTIALVQPDVESQKAIDQLIFKYLKYLLRLNNWYAGFEEFVPFSVDFAVSMKSDFEINPLMITESDQETLNEFYEKNGL